MKLKNISIGSSASRRKRTQDALTKKRIYRGENVRLEGVVRQQTDKLKTQSDKLKSGENRQKLSDEQINRQTGELKTQGDQLRFGKSKQKLADAEILIQTKAMDSTTDGIFLLDATKTNLPFVYANASFFEITGYTKKDIIGQGYFSLKGFFSDDRIIEEIKNTLRQGKPFHCEVLNFKKNGDKYWNLLRITPVRNAGRSITHCIGINTDMTLIKQKNL